MALEGFGEGSKTSSVTIVIQWLAYLRAGPASWADLRRHFLEGYLAVTLSIEIRIKVSQVIESFF